MLDEERLVAQVTKPEALPSGGMECKGRTTQLQGGMVGTQPGDPDWKVPAL